MPRICLLDLTSTLNCNPNTNRVRRTRLTGFSVNTQASRYQKGKTNLDFTEVREVSSSSISLGHMHLAPDR